MAQLVRFYLFGGFVDGQRLLSPASVTRIETSETNVASKDGFVYGYGLGNAIFPDSGPTFRGHNGSIDSFTAVMGYNRRSNSGYVLMANGGEGVDFATPIAHMVQAYLTRDWKMSPAPTVKVSAAELANYAGFYRSVTPPNNLLRPYTEILGLARVQAGDGKLIVSGNDFLPVSAHVFRRHDREDPSLAFVEDGGRIYKVGAFNAAMREPFWLIAAAFVIVAIVVVGTLFGLAMLIPWIVFAVQGKLAARGGFTMRLLPLLSTGALAVMAALPIMAYSDAGASAVHRLADIGPYSLTIMVASVLFPLLALAGLGLGLRNGEARAIVRGYVVATSLALLVLSGYFASIGWFAMRTWEM